MPKAPVSSWVFLISLFGPGPATFVNTDTQWYLLAADMTALPALIANLARLPADAQGYVVIEILAHEDRQQPAVPVDDETESAVLQGGAWCSKIALVLIQLLETGLAGKGSQDRKARGRRFGLILSCRRCPGSLGSGGPSLAAKGLA